MVGMREYRIKRKCIGVNGRKLFHCRRSGQLSIAVMHSTRILQKQLHQWTLQRKIGFRVIAEMRHNTPRHMTYLVVAIVTDRNSARLAAT